MKIRKELNIQKVGGENVILLQGRHGLDTTKIVSLNETSLWLWNRFADEPDFTVEQVAAALVEEYEIDTKEAAKDAAGWTRMMHSNMLIEE